MFGENYDEVHELYPTLDDRRLIYEIIRRMINTVVTDLIDETQRRLDAARPQSIDEVRKADKPLVAMSPAVFEQHMALKRFLNEHLYRHEKKLEMTARVQAVVEDLFATFMADPATMPAQFAAAAAQDDEADSARVVADYGAGMTDRYALAEHERISG